MTVNPLPPQAYTRETLQKAYTWLLNQSASVKDMATSQDILVSMYLKAQRSGDAALETPSIQNFKQELKNLASMIGDLQTPAKNNSHQATPNLQAQHSQHTTQHTQQNSYATTLPTYSSPSASIPVNTVNKTHSMPQSFVQNPQPATPNGLNGSNASLNLDEQSLLAVNEVKSLLNLSSDTEALRALISLGYKHFKKINS